MNIHDAYEASQKRDGHVRDPAQSAVVDKLLHLQRAITAANPPAKKFLSNLFNRRRPTPTDAKGLYLWGGVGRGKTFLMDLFFETLAEPRKKRIHFHRMMRDVHARLRALDGIEDPLNKVAADIAEETRVLCFDEFFVSDIGDAMILGRLLDGLFQRHVILVTTSNARPDDLYPDGLQRQQFLPAIDLLNTHTDVVNLDGGTDYRLRLLQAAGTWLAPDDDLAKKKLDYYFDESATSEIRNNCELQINDREIDVQKRAKGIVWFNFNAICAGPRSQADYIEIAQWYPSVIISGVPQLDAMRDDQARRFIALIDEFYDRRVKLMVSAACSAESLYSGKRLTFEIERTISRLIEMQSSEYLALPHLA